MEDLLSLTNEKIFYTVQGEGKYCGYPSIFIRLSGCNLKCEWQNPDGTTTICDTPHASYTPQINKLSIDDIIKQVQLYNCKHVVITGGEPFLQPNVTKLIGRLTGLGYFVTVETNGTIYRENDASCISMSPKLATSTFNPNHQQELLRRNWESVKSFTQKHFPSIQYKFVVNTIEDMDEIIAFKDRVMADAGIDINDRIWLMPQGTTKEQFDIKMEDLVIICKQYGWKLTDRLHIRIWGSKVGV